MITKQRFNEIKQINKNIFKDRTFPIDIRDLEISELISAIEILQGKMSLTREESCDISWEKNR